MLAWRRQRAIEKQETDLAGELRGELVFKLGYTFLRIVQDLGDVLATLLGALLSVRDGYESISSSLLVVIRVVIRSIVKIFIIITDPKL